MSPRRPEVLLPRLLVVFLIALTACVQTPPPRVGVRNLTSEIVFGIPSLDEPVGPPNTGIDFEPFLSLDQAGYEPPPPRPPRQRGPCPVAGTQSVRDLAPTVVEGLPKVGEYQWKVSGTATATATHSFPLPRQQGFFEPKRRIVTGVVTGTAIGGGRYDLIFKTIQSEVLPDKVHGLVSVETTYRVTQSARVETKSRPSPLPSPSPPPSPLPQEQPEETVDTPVNGIWLIRQVKRNERGETINIFEPDPPVLIIPIPFNENTVIAETTSVDKLNGNYETWRYAATVRKRKVYDACGENVQGWFVDGERTVRALRRDPVEIDYDYAVATHFGGLIVFEHQALPCEGSKSNPDYDPSIQDPNHPNANPVLYSCPSPTLMFDANIGQLIPDPLSGTLRR